MGEVYAMWLDPKWRSSMEPNFYKFIPVLKNNLSGNKSKKERKEGRKENKRRMKQGREEKRKKAIGTAT